jgi:hypothetical protein
MKKVKLITSDSESEVLKSRVKTLKEASLAKEETEAEYLKKDYYRVKVCNLFLFFTSLTAY